MSSNASNFFVTVLVHPVVFPGSTRQGAGWFLLLLAFLQGQVNLVRDRRAGRAAGPAVLDHHNHDIARVLTRRERGKPGRVPHRFAALSDLSRSGLGANSHARHETPGTR